MNVLLAIIRKCRKLTSQALGNRPPVPLIIRPPDPLHVQRAHPTRNQLLRLQLNPVAASIAPPRSLHGSTPQPYSTPPSEPTPRLPGLQLPVQLRRRHDPRSGAVRPSFYPPWRSTIRQSRGRSQSNGYPAFVRAGKRTEPAGSGGNPKPTPTKQQLQRKRST